MSSVSDFSADKVFNNREKLMEWVKNEALSHRQVIVIKRSKTKNGYTAKIIFMCERGGVSKSKSTPEKSTPCKKIDCKFEMVAKFSKTKGVWSITMINPAHNHQSIMYMEGHAYAMRLTDDEFRLVADLSRNNVKPCEILATLKERNPENVYSNKTIYNAKAKLWKFNHKQGLLIPLESIDIFWKTLDFSPCISAQDGDLRCDAELDMLSLSLIQEPAVHITTRGRPNVKVQKQKATFLFHMPPHDLPRSSYSNKSNLDGFDLPDLNQEPARHSSYVHRTFFSDPLLDQIPEIFRLYVMNIHNVIGDENCGLRSVASCLGLHEECWPQIRMELLDEIRMHQATYTNMFGEVGLLQLSRTINLPAKTRACSKYWMDMLTTSLLIASRYNVILLFLSNDGDTTCFPLWSSPHESQQHYVCVIARVHGNHFVKVDLQGYYPVPRTHPSCTIFKFDSEWERPYKNQQDLYNEFHPSSNNCDFVNLDD